MKRERKKEGGLIYFKYKSIKDFFFFVWYDISAFFWEKKKNLIQLLGSFDS